MKLTQSAIHSELFARSERRITSIRVSSSLNSKVRCSQPAQTAWGARAVMRAGSVRDLFQTGFLVWDVEKYPEKWGRKEAKRER